MAREKNQIANSTACKQKSSPSPSKQRIEASWSLRFPFRAVYVTFPRSICSVLSILLCLALFFRSCEHHTSSQYLFWAVDSAFSRGPLLKLFMSLFYVVFVSRCCPWIFPQYLYYVVDLDVSRSLLSKLLMSPFLVESVPRCRPCISSQYLYAAFDLALSRMIFAKNTNSNEVSLPARGKIRGIFNRLIGLELV